MSETMTYEFRLKCRNCGLHYALFSWDENWDEKHKEAGYCPECGIGGVKIVWGPVPHDRPVFEFVPGDAEQRTNLKTGEEYPSKATRGMRMTHQIAGSPFGIPQHMTEPH